MLKIFPGIFSNDTVLKPYIILLLLVALAFANSLQNSFLWDDLGLIVDNPKIELPLKEIFSVFTIPLWKMAGEAVQTYYRPMVSLLFILDYKIWGLNPVGFHLTNIFLHIIAAIVLYRIGLFLFAKEKNAKLISFLAASLFAIHPAHNEPIGRAASGEVIFGFFIIISLYFFLRDKKYLSWLTFFLALMSKEAAVMLPFALIILSFDKKGLKKGLLAIIPYIILAGIYIVIRAIFADSVLGDNVKRPLFTRLITMAVAALDYVKLFLIPYPLSPHYPERWYTSILELKAIFAIFVLISMVAFAFKLKKDRVMLFLLSFPFIMLAPVVWRANTFPVELESVYIAERFLYVPVMLFSLLISAYAVRLAGEKSKNHLIVGWTLIIFIFTGITVSSNTIWKDNSALYTKIIQVYPDTAFAHNNLGDTYIKQGHINEAIKEFKTAISLKPDLGRAYYNLGNAYVEQGHINEAIIEYKTAIRLWPGYADTHYNLGNIYAKQNSLSEAIKEYTITIRLRPDADAHNNLGVVYLNQGLTDEAMIEFKKALRLKPDYVAARKNLEILYGKKNSMKK